MKKREWKVVTFGLGGASATDADTSLYSYDGGDRFLAVHGAEMVDGCWVIDQRAVLESNPGAAFRSPLVSTKMRDDDPVDRVSDRLAVTAGSLGIAELVAGNYFGLAGVAALQPDTASPGPFDYVSPARYASWWADRGARVGRWSTADMSVVWWD